MEIKYKTNIKCDACVAKVTPALNETVGENQWKVDLTDPARVLTVTVQEDKTNSLAEALQKVGYKAERLD
ncbi:MAG: cation transporter [Cytophagales bacterium]|jgi:copper chaperone|nr:cation transporter [Cytophagales bacterium]HRE67158.1 cation transporter [Cyclobacteriaceae bacterium]